MTENKETYSNIKAEADQIDEKSASEFVQIFIKQEESEETIEENVTAPSELLLSFEPTIKYETENITSQDQARTKEPTIIKPNLDELNNESLKSGPQSNQNDTKNSAVKKTFPCTFCPKEFKTKNYLTSHMNVHIEEKKFICQICETKFKRKNDLKKHLTTHDDERNFACELCPKKFKVKKYLTYHMTVHSDERKFACPICSKTFKRKEDLTSSHMRIHDDERRFACHLCPRKFKRNGHLKDHINTHFSHQVRGHFLSETKPEG